ncbi:ABC transporter substrate-binding protein [Amycolatopsis sp. FDAARGOS 1241]|uniref:ABC transporter substrate-binding protein n=1 Tax=Amycolatopsis sp. FDAARGOS 1241 TaxID=2778070 RepID=UPI00194EF7EE|nr:ABC transporter substrate-binding protein [Amycolatopsis sp. FDAARGOS 1241]QRP50473.1 ABC transporter substrate-binding protein [Amycolatopsis sp. FDAARGOS 1241]
MAEHLLTVTRTQGNNRALKEGEVAPAGFSLAFKEEPVLVDGFRRMVRELAYDVCEMALTTYLTAREHGVRFTALPVFLVRGFHHGAILVRKGSGITEPGHLAGKRVGVNRGYTVTTGVWARAIMALEHGLDLDSVTWVLSGDEHVESYRPPRNVVPAGPGNKLADMLLAGELDAVVNVKIDSPEVVPLIANPEEAGFTALRERGFYPVNHLVVVKDEVLDAHPGVAKALFDAFAECKRRYVEQLRAGVAETADDRRYSRVMAETGDPLPYGIETNRAVLELLAEQALAQHILTKPVAVESMFAPATRELVG